MVDIENSHDDIALERYVGANQKEFVLIEDELKKIIKLIKRNFPTISERGMTLAKKDVRLINNSDSNVAIQRYFTKLFDLNRMSLYWTDKSDANASTYPSSFMFKNKMDESGNYSGEGKMNIGVAIDISLVSYADMNEKEILSIILHEIGHNFYNSIFNTLARLPISLTRGLTPESLTTIGTQVALLVGTDIVRNGDNTVKGIQKIDELLFEYAPGLRKVYSLYRETILNFENWVYVRLRMKGFFRRFALEFRTLFVSGKKILSNVVDTIQKRDPFTTAYFARYNTEKFADSFATDHGYGIHLQRALIKMSNPKRSISVKVTNEIPGFSWIVDFFSLQYDIISGVLNQYPTHQNRIRTSLDRLKREAKRADMDADLKRDLEAQIKEFEDFYQNEYLSIDSDENKKKVFSWIYKNAVEKIFQGKMDARELLYALDPHKYK